MQVIGVVLRGYQRGLTNGGPHRSGVTRTKLRNGVRRVGQLYRVIPQDTVHLSLVHGDAASIIAQVVRRIGIPVDYRDDSSYEPDEDE